MKVCISFAILLFFCAMVPAKKKKVIFFGDSITQMGMNKGGYIDRMQHDLSAQGKEGRFELVGAGVGGNKIYDLYLRMEADVLDKKPSIVVIYIGVNDIWHKTSGIGTDIEKFEQFYTAIIQKLKARKIKVILATPCCIGELTGNLNPQDDDLDKYSDVIRRLAATYQCRLVDLRAAWRTYEEEHNIKNEEKGLLTTDRVHLNDTGNQLVAGKMLNVLLAL